jgi:hypothetical protein
MIYRDALGGIGSVVAVLWVCGVIKALMAWR